MPVATTAEDAGDWGNIFTGSPYGVQFGGRWAFRVPKRDPTARPMPAKIIPLRIHQFRVFGDIPSNFGSAHPSTWNAVFCDGSVHSLSYNIDLATHQAFVNPAAGDSPDEKQY